jgi:ABC-type transport system substrate-binding protein
MIRQFYFGVILLLGLVSCTSGVRTSEFGDSGKKIFRYNQADGLSSLDPAFARNQANIWATTQLYNGLFELSNELFPVPSLAETWTVSDDGLVYEISLKRGILFHDSEVFENGKGREVKAEDFVYSFKRIVDPVTASTGAWIFNDKVKRDASGEIAEDWISADGDYKLRIVLDRPFGPFLEILTMPYTYVVPKEAIERYGKDFRVHPVGTGPFVFKSWEEGSSLIMLRNNHYWKRDIHGRQLPYLDAVQVSFISDRNQELLTFQQKKIDFMSGILANSADLVLNKDGSIRKEFAGNFVVQKAPYLNTEYIGFLVDNSLYNGKDHPVLHKKFRQAMSYAINREEMIGFLLNNLGAPGTAGVVPSALAAYDASVVSGYNYDPKKAQSLLKESGFGPGGKEIPVIKLYTTVHSKAFVEYLQKQWQAIGIPVEIELNPVPTHQELIENSKVQFFRGSWLADYPDAENYFALFYSKNFSPIGPNKTHFKSEEFDRLYEQAKNELDGFRRIAIYQQMDNLIMEEAPVIVLFYDEVLRLTQNNVIGLEPNPMNVLRLERADFMQGEVIQ